MGGSVKKGSITVFFSLTGILFLSLVCTIAESGRIQGAKTQTANIMGMGNFSVMSEFEPELLEKYEIFALDGAYGSGSFSISQAEKKLEEYLLLNTSPQKEGLGRLCFDPWNLRLKEQKIGSYALLTDEKGEAFYQQAVAFMTENMEYFVMDQLLTYKNQSQYVQNYQRRYEAAIEENSGRLSGLEEQKQEKLEEIESEKQEEGNSAQVQAAQQAQTIQNPLTVIAKLRRKSTLELVTGGKTVSDKRLSGQRPSKSSLKKGSLKLPKEQSGTTANILFREYLMQYFSSYTDQETTRPLEYQAEYLIAGKDTDEANLKYVVNRLLLLREGFNYLYCLGNAQISAQANALAVSLTGFLGIPALTAATGQAIMLAWAYGESLIDVRTLLDGGKVPLNKSAQTWSLSLENLAQIAQILQGGAVRKDDGLDYEEYLRILLHLGIVSNQKMRGLDLIQMELQNSSGMSKFQVQNCIVGIKSSAVWECAPVFFRIPMRFLGMAGQKTVFSQEGSISY